MDLLHLNQPMIGLVTFNPANEWPSYILNQPMKGLVAFEAGQWAASNLTSGHGGGAAGGVHPGAQRAVRGRAQEGAKDHLQGVQARGGG